MPKQSKSIHICTLYDDMENFYRSKSISRQTLKRYLEETDKIIEYHIQQKQEFLKSDLLYKLTKKVYMEGLLDIRSIYLKTVYLVVEFGNLNIDAYIIKKQLLDDINQKFIEEWRKTHSEDALPTIKSIMTHFLMYLYFNDVYDLKELEFTLLEGYIMYMHKINKHITVFDNITKLRRILFYLYHMNYTDKDFSQYLYGLKAYKNERLPDQYSLEEVNQLITSVKNEKEKENMRLY